MTLWHFFIPVVAIFSAWTVDRFVHLAWAIGFFLGFLFIASGYRAFATNRSFVIRYWLTSIHPKNRSPLHGLILALFVLFLGSWIPDIDWKFGVHRSPLTHSILPFFVIGALAKNWQWGDIEWTKQLMPLFGISLGSHLIVDFFQGGNLIGIPAKSEFAFYTVNGLAVCTISYLQIRRALLEHKLT
jgi:hypothetical protein